MKKEIGWYHGFFVPSEEETRGFSLERNETMEFNNKNPKIFIIAGIARQGKDTVASMIHQYYEKEGKNCINLQISHYIKEYAKQISGWDGREETKPRELLQQLGTDLIRKNIDNELFIRRTVEDIKVYSYFYDIITLSDARFDYEVATLKEQFSYASFIKIERPNQVNDLGIFRNHATENGLQNDSYYDTILCNDGTLEDLNKKVVAMLEGKK